MKLVAKVYEGEDGRAVVGYVDGTYPDPETVDLMFDAWRVTHSEELRLCMLGIRKTETVKATFTGGDGI